MSSRSRVRPVLLGDRFYGSPALIAWCRAQGWDWRLRLKQDLLVFEAEGPKVLAVLDWELSTLGHPFADFSYHCMAWHIPPGAFVPTET